MENLDKKNNRVILFNGRINLPKWMVELVLLLITIYSIYYIWINTMELKSNQIGEIMKNENPLQEIEKNIS